MKSWRYLIGRKDYQVSVKVRDVVLQSDSTGFDWAIGKTKNEFDEW